MLGLGLDIPTIALRNELVEGITITYITEGSVDYINESGVPYTNEAGTAYATSSPVPYSNENSTQLYVTEG